MLKKVILVFILCLPLIVRAESGSETIDDLASMLELDLEGLSQVTIATRREKNVQDVGISVTILSGISISDLNINYSTDIYQHIAGASFNAVGGRGNLVAVYLRGAGINDFNDNQESPVGIYIDDTYLAFTGGFTFPLFDLERAEILRGPQGTLFGRNVTGGLLHFISRRPADEFEGYLDLTLAQNKQVRLEGMVNGSWGDNLSGRLSFVRNEHDPYVSNRIGEDGNEANDYGIRGQLLVQPHKDVNVLLTTNYANNDINSWHYQHQATFADSQGIARKVGNNQNPHGTCNGCDPLGYKDTDGDPFKVDQDMNGFLKTEMVGMTANIVWNLGWADLTSISNYTKFEKEYLEDSDGTPISSVSFGTDTKASQWSQELRLQGETEKTHWDVGAYYLSVDIDGQLQVDSGAGNTSVVNPALNFFGGDGWIVNYDLKQGTESASLFGQLEYDLHPEWTIIAGIRYVNEKKEFDFFNTVTVPNTTTTTIQVDFDKNTVGELAELKSSPIQAKLELDWKPNKDFFVYGSVTRGTKAGAFNAPLFPIAEETIPVDEEILTNFEVGFKSYLFGGKALLNGSAYYFKYQDYQAFAFDQTASKLFNTDAQAQGLELELYTRPIQGLDISVSSAYIQSKVENISNGTITRDTELPGLPGFELNSRIRYQWPAMNGKVAVQFSHHYQNEQHFEIQNDPGLTQESYGVANARVSYQSQDSTLLASFFVNNIFDTEYVESLANNTGFGMIHQYYGRPRWLGLEFRLKW